MCLNGLAGLLGLLCWFVFMILWLLWLAGCALVITLVAPFWICLINSVVSHGLLCWSILLICVWVLYVFGYFGCFGLLGWVGCAFRFVVFGAYAADLLRLWL